ncbi:MAG: CoA transferase [Dehalococcoidia bacterium]|nr:CoA transferase [Dehalococcoidia bacterium]
MALALEGIKVIDVSQVAAVPVCARHLADFGADVIHVENPLTGDSWRIFQDVSAAGRQAAPSAINYNWENYNRNKRSLTLDIAKEGGRNILYKLIEQTDVFVSNLRAFELERYGLEHATLRKINPRIISGNVSGYGKTGPDKNLPAYDTTAYWTRAAIPYVLSYPGVPCMGYRPGIGDNVTGLGLAFGVMLALYAREKTGLGQEVDTSLLHMGLYQNSFDVAGALATGMNFEDWRENPPPEVVAQAQMANMQVMAFYGNKATNPLSGAYVTSDFRIVVFVALQPDRYWTKFCQCIGREDLAKDARYSTTEGRAEHCTLLRQEISQTFMRKPLADWVPLLEGMPYAPLQNLKEVINDPQARAAGCFVAYDHPAHGRIEALANPVNLSGTPATVRMPAPEFGQHTEEVLVEAGYSWEDIARFKEQGLIA